MSPTSSELVSGRVERRQMLRYHRTFWLVALLGLAATVIALIAYALQGPRLRSAGVDLVRSIQFPDTALSMEADRPLGPVDTIEVSVNPDVPVTLEADGTALRVVFASALDYDTDYRVELSGVVGAEGGPEASWSYEFRTPAGSLFYLERSEFGQPDRVMSAELGTSPPREIYRAEHIDTFVPIGSALVVSATGPDGLSTLEIVQAIRGDRQRLVLPADVIIDQMVTPASGTSVFFTLSSVEEDGPYDRTLFRIDTAGSPRAEPVVGLDGQPLRVTKASVVPGAPFLVAWVDDVEVVSINLQTGLVLPIALEAQEFWGVSTTGQDVVLVDLGGTVAIGRESLVETRLIPGTLGGREVFEGYTQLLADGRKVQTVALGNQSGTDFTSLVVIDDGSGRSQELYRTPGDLGSIGTIVVSPNDQYAAIEVVPNRLTAQSDGRLFEPRSTSSQVVIVDIDSRAVVRSVEGVWPVW